MFATLDTSSRRLRFPRERDVIITDTVGFIHNLPEDLFNAFRATLDEMEDADLLLHLVDASHPRLEQHMKAVADILEKINLSRKKTLLVFNKADVAGWPKCREIARRHGGICLSALEPSSFPPLLESIEKLLWPGRQSVDEP